MTLDNIRQISACIEDMQAALEKIKVINRMTRTSGLGDYIDYADDAIHSFRKVVHSDLRRAEEQLIKDNTDQSEIPENKC